MVRWGVYGGVVCGLLLAAASPFLGPLFSRDAQVHDLLVPVLVIAAIGQPVAGVVFVLDGVLIGAGDGRYLARAGLVVLLVYAPVALAAAYTTGGLVVVWVAFAGVFMGARYVVLTRRARGDCWLVTGTLRTPAASRRRSP
jgi:Na+-driven multidrug efflux pump